MKLKSKKLIIGFCIYSFWIFLYSNFIYSQEVYLGIKKSFEKIDIFVDSSKTTGSNINNKELVEGTNILKFDLEFSNFFRISPVGIYTQSNPILYIIKSYIKKENEFYVLKGDILDGSSGQVIMSSIFKDKEFRRVYHKYSDFIVSQLIGEKTSFLSKIVYVSTKTGKYTIMMMDYDGYNKTILVKNNYINISPALSPDHKYLAYVSYKYSIPSIILKNLQTQEEFNITRGFDYAGSPSFSHDGTKLAFSASRHGNSDIYIYDIKTKKITRVTRHWGIDTQPAFSPTDKEIVFTSDRGGMPQIYIINIDGTLPTRISFEGKDNEDPSWSPDGTKIVYASYRDHGFKIVIKNIITGEEFLYTASNNNESPTWAPDGQHIAFEVGYGSYRQIKVLDLLTGESFYLTKIGSNFSPNWSFK